jgi:hypothetical protein
MFSNNEPISFKMKQDLLPKIQGKTLLIPSLHSLLQESTIRQERIKSFNNWVQYTKATSVTPFDSFEEEIMKSRIIIIKESKDAIPRMDQRKENSDT